MEDSENRLIITVMRGRQYNCRHRARDAARGDPKGVQQPKEAQAAVINAI
jgi:hypothetical protein